MTNLMSILSTGGANIKLEVSGEDLRQFSEDLINRAVSEVAAAISSSQDDSLLTKEEVKRLCNATLWHWDKRNCLNPVRVGAKVMYRNEPAFELPQNIVRQNRGNVLSIRDVMNDWCGIGKEFSSVDFPYIENFCYLYAKFTYYSKYYLLRR